MHLREELLRGIYGYGFEKPSAIQQRAIAPCIKGHDVIAQAQSGTGKTATFSISILEKIDINARDCQALILAPTRELAQQIQKVVMALDYMGVQCLHRRHLCERGHAQAGGRSTHCGGYTWQSVRHDLQEVLEDTEHQDVCPGRS